MNYEKKYNEALERAREELGSGCYNKGTIEYIFPELAESDNELTWLTRYIEEEAYSLSIDIRDNEDRIKLKKLQKALSWLEKQGEKRKITHEEICQSYGIPNIGEFSDGYHTFNGLYKQRMILFAVLVKTYKDKAWKSWKHEDGLDCFGGGWFIVGIDTPEGTYTYHYEAKDWDRFDCKILEKAKHWDGHDEFDVERLFSLVSNTNKDEVIRCLINGMKFYYEDNEEATWGTEKFSMKVKDILSWLEKQGKADIDKNIAWLEQQVIKTIEQKAKAYDEALERARKLYERGTITESLGYVFPELKESEDKGICEQIISFIEEYGNPVHCEWQKDWIAWLEKQEEQKQQYKSTTVSSSDITTVTNENECFTH